MRTRMRSSSAARIVISLCLTCLASLASKPSTLAQVPELVQHWPLDGDYFNAVDEEFDGYLGEDPVSTEVIFEEITLAEGEMGPDQEEAARFQGANNYIQTDYPGIGGQEPRSITFWMKVAEPGSTAINDFFGYGTPTNGLKWHTRINTGAAQGPVGAIRTEYQGGQNVGATLINDGEWHHIAVVFPPAATNGHQIIHYVDGNAESISPTSTDRVITTELNPAYTVTLGLTRQSPTSRRWLNGWLADVRVYSGGLSPTNVREVMDNEELSEPPACETLEVTCAISEETNSMTATVTLAPEDCLCESILVSAGDEPIGSASASGGAATFRLDQICALAAGEDVELTFTCVNTELSATCTVSCPAADGLEVHWPLNAEEGDTEFVDLISGFDGYLPDGSTVMVDPDGPPIGEGGAPISAVAFSGTDSWIQTDYPGIWGASARTITAWIKTTEPVINHGIIAWGQDATTRKWHIRLNNTASNGQVGGLRVEINGGYAIGSTPLADGEWHHIAIVVPDGASTTEDVLHYVDGFYDQPSNVNPLEINTNAGAGARTLEIGRRVPGVNGTPNYFPGSIADVRVYDVALDETELLSLATGGRCRAVRALSSARFLPGDSVTVTLRTVNVSAGMTLTETFPTGWTVSGNPDGGTVNDSTIVFALDDAGELTYELTIPDDFCESAEISGALSGDDCDSVVLGASSLTCREGCLELSDTGGVREMLVIGPIAAGRNTNASGQCDDFGPDGETFATVDYLVNVDGDGESDLDVAVGDEIVPDFGGLAAGAGVAPAPNTAINPRRDEGILTVWSADANTDGLILFNDADNIGNPLDDYIVYTLVYLDNRTGDDLPAVLEVGSDDAAKVIVNGELALVEAACHGVQAYGNGVRVPLDGDVNSMLRPGANSVLIGIVERGGGTGVRLVVRDEFDAPLTDGSVAACLSTRYTSVVDPVEDCENGVDDDGDDLVDCLDDDCAGDPSCPSEITFVRGDANSTGTIDLTDGIRTLNFLFTGGPEPTCLDAADSSDDGQLGINDAIQVFSFLFTGGPPPRDPAPSNTTYPASDCGVDPTDDDLGCEATGPVCAGDV